MKTLRILTKTLLLLLAVGVAPFTIFFWLFAWTPFAVVSVTLFNLIEFAKGTNDFENYNLIWWFFWLVVMWNEEKSGEYL